MQFVYGSFVHPNNEVAFGGISRSIMYSETQRANILRESWNMKGKFVYQGATAQTQIMAALIATKAAYSVSGYSAMMMLNNGQPSSWVLNNANAIGGVIVTDPVSHGQIMGAEGVTYLHYTFGLQMDSFISDGSTLLSYQEAVSFSDIAGGPLQVGRVPISGMPIIQSISTNSFYYATQQGALSMRTPNPQPEAMIWPESLMGEDGSRQITYQSPKMQRGIPTEFGVSWSYRYRRIVPFQGSVHARG